jgi:alkylated DNA repair dioxygenase AlkB
MEVRNELKPTQSSTSVKPTIDTSREWSGDLKTADVYNKNNPKLVNTMRTVAAKPNEHFGNPFSEAGYGGTIKVSGIPAAVKMYKDWLLYNAVTESEIVSGSVNDLAKFDNQRAWILDQINQGKLDGATLLYAGKSAARGQGMHPTALAEVVEILRSSKLGISSEKKKVLKNEKGLIIINNAIPLKQTQEIVEDSKKFIEDTSFKQTNGSVSWGYGMQWIRSSALTPKQKEGVQVGKQLGGDEITQDMVDRLKKGLPVKMPLYVYTIYDKNGNRLPNIPSNIINLLQEQGIDVSQYDASYNSVYDKNDKGSLIVHQDNTEFNTSPIITVSLGRPMKFITYQLKDPGNYSFGTNAKNRYELVLNTISNKLQAQNLAPELKRQKNFQGNMVIAYGELTPGNLAKYAKMVGEESAALEALSDSIEKIEEHTLTNGAVLVFSNQNRNVFHEIIFDEQTDAVPMPEGFPELTINKAYKGLGHADKMVKTKDYRVVLTLRKVNGTTSIDSVDTNKLVSQPPVQTTGTNNPSNFKNFSGGQTDGSITKGGDTAWYETGKDFGVENHTFYKPQDFDALGDDAKSQLNTQYAEVVSFLGRGILRPETTAGKLVRRDMMQANSADAIYGVTTLIAPGKTDRSGKYPNRKAYITPDGGTGYALARGILSNKPVYVYNQSNSQGVETGWYKWENGNFVATAVPVLTKNFAGVGTRELNAEGKQAIKEVYAKTFPKPALALTDKIIWGHPGLGKTTFRKQNPDKVLDFDTDFKPVIAEILGLPVDEQNSVGLNKWRKENGDEEFNKVMRKVWAIAKNMAKEENKILVVSDMIFLRENASDFDKVITTSKEAFVKRATERGDDAKSLESWKSSIDKTIAGIDQSKVISTDKYLSDLLAAEPSADVVYYKYEVNKPYQEIGTVYRLTPLTKETFEKYKSNFNTSNYNEFINKVRNIQSKDVEGTNAQIGPGFPTVEEKSMDNGKTWTVSKMRGSEWLEVYHQSRIDKGWATKMTSDQYAESFKSNSPTGPLTNYTSIEELEKNPIFEELVIDFVNEIKTDKDTPVAMRTLKAENKVRVVTDLMYKKYEEKAWTTPSIQNDGTKATPLAENAFGTFNEFLTFALLHEKAHFYLKKNTTETVGQYEDRINDEAMRRLNEIPNKEAKTERVVDQEQVFITDEMIQDFMFNVCK